MVAGCRKYQKMRRNVFYGQEDEEDICQRILNIISESSHFEGCNVIQVGKILILVE